MESSSPPWRVFDAPSGQPAARQAGEHEPQPPGLAVQPVVLMAAGGAVLIGALAVALAVGGNGSVDVAPGGNGNVAVAASSAVVGGEVVVDIGGAVVTPGVYRLAAGARVGDAIDAAGGFSNRVDADRVAAELNLAAAVSDGQQIRVPSRDDPATRTAAPGSGAGSSGGLIDLNTATQAELESLPGIGPVTATKILDARAQTPFASIDELRERGLVGEKTFDSIRALITVG
jgi:competence protein ComEA